VTAAIQNTAPCPKKGTQSARTPKFTVMYGGMPPDRRGLQGPYLRQRLCITFYFMDFAHRPVSKLVLLLLVSKTDGAQSPWSIHIWFQTLYCA